MSEKQQTIKKAVSVKGVGLHTGKAVTMRFKAAPENHGIKFKRTDLDGKPEIKADADLVVEVERGTTLEQNGARVATVEHVLAAVTGMGIDNALIELNAEELPIMDGSSIPFVKALKKAGVEEQEAERQYFEIEEILHFSMPDSEVELTIVPADSYQITCMIDFDSPVLGSQHAKLEALEDFEENIADARTFCFLRELEFLYENNLVRGGDLNNAIVIVDREVKEDELDRLRKMFNKKNVKVKHPGILNGKKLRYPNEPARHKLLDIVGDLTLIGKPIKGKVIASRPGHAANVEFAKKIKQLIKEDKRKVKPPKYDPSIPPLFDIIRIKQFLPHRYPMLLVDKIIELTDERVVGVKSVSGNEAFFQGHFPDHPIMPGVLQIEAMAQTGGILAMTQYPDPENYETYFIRIEKARFKNMVVPGDTLIMKMELLRPIRRGICEMRATAFVGGKIATEGELVAQIRRKPDA